MRHEVQSVPKDACRHGLSRGSGEYVQIEASGVVSPKDDAGKSIFSGNSTSACALPVAGLYVMFTRSCGATEPSFAIVTSLLASFRKLVSVAQKAPRGDVRSTGQTQSRSWIEPAQSVEQPGLT